MGMWKLKIIKNDMKNISLTRSLETKLCKSVIYMHKPYSKKIIKKWKYGCNAICQNDIRRPKIDMYK